jgi:superfamily I DNA/RNA helicase
VDEYQDINFAQYALIRLLAPGGQSGRTLSVIGDPNQAIYAFRGSDKRFIDRFLTDYPDAACFHLSESFRCAAPIIDAAVHLVREPVAAGYAPQSAAASQRGTASFRGAPRVARLFRAEYPTEKSEAEGIARRISRLVGGTTFFAIDSGIATSTDTGIASNTDSGTVDPAECTILLRTLSLAPPVTQALMDHGIPFRLSREIPWWEEEPLNSLLTLLRDSPVVSSSLAETIQATWKKLVKGKTIKIPRNANTGGMNVEAAVERLMSMSRFFDALPAFLDMLSVSATTVDGEAPDRGGVAIMTMHASKGLEFDHVFVAGLEEGIMPFTLYEMEQKEEHLEEEKRLLYVAMTRARHGLYLSYAKKRVFQGRKLEQGKSRFFDDLETLVPQLTEARRPRDSQLSLF